MKNISTLLFVVALFHVAVLCALYLNRYRFRPGAAPMWARATLISFGFALIALGYFIASTSGLWIGLFGAFLVVTGVQIAMGMMGLKSDLIGNREVGGIREFGWNREVGASTVRANAAIPSVREMAEGKGFELPNYLPLFRMDRGRPYADPYILASILSLRHIEEWRSLVEEAVLLFENIRIRSWFRYEDPELLQNKFADILGRLRAEILLSVSSSEQSFLIGIAGPDNNYPIPAVSVPERRLNPRRRAQPAS